jgi:hypothetical protein
VIRNHGLSPQTRAEWVHYLNRVTNRAVDLLASLVEDLGPALAFSPQSPEVEMVRSLIALVHDAGGSVALDCLRARLRRRLAGVLCRAELGKAMGDLQSRIADAGRP